MHKYFPSVWIGDFDAKSAFDARSKDLKRFFDVIDTIDDRLLASRHPFDLDAYCAACDDVRTMRLTWHFAASNGSGSVNPAWTETATCSSCGLNSRMRAVVDFVRTRLSGPEARRTFMAERITASYRIFKSMLPDVTGSEYLGVNYKPGEYGRAPGCLAPVRNEDISRLSFDDATFDLVITQDVFEHVPDIQRAFSECCRVLAPGGRLVFTIPFFCDQEKTLVRATMSGDGSIEHLHPPEFHGNPISQKGSLCFRNFGWDIVDQLEVAGFDRTIAAMYWGPWQGHFGFPFFVFEATRR